VTIGQRLLSPLLLLLILAGATLTKTISAARVTIAQRLLSPLLLIVDILHGMMNYR
jgi:hypothetical protein